ncbi:MAG: DNA topoisomerase IV subunit A [Alphaproteobacteria bacterium]
MTEQKNQILVAGLQEALGDRYLSYALSTIMSRSLPDVRDGLKPVHRRLLYAMRQLRITAAGKPKKSARVVGDVIGQYHPHGDTAVYDALVRLAQDFSVRYMLIDGQGNFGNIDGDNAAAMRYTEARLTEVAEVLLQGIDDDAVDFRETYDNEGSEPIVLPAGFPNLLANGSNGIAVGMATSIPPHNAGEICDALLYLIKSPNATMEKIVSFMPGPDFPTGGVMIESPESILQSYETGRGSFRLRARWEIEKGTNGQYEIIVTEIPYQIQKSRLIEKIAHLLDDKRLPLLSDVRDESAEDIRMVLVPRTRAVDPEVLMASLFHMTDLETRISLNLNVLDKDCVPGVMNLRQALHAFLEHRHVVLIRRNEYRLGKINHRLEILDGLLIAYLNIDEVIKIIRENDEPKPLLMKRFKLTEIQADAILNMRLRSLRKLEEMGITGEHAELSAEKALIEELLSNEDKRWTEIGVEIKDIKKRFGQKTKIGARRTDVADVPAEISFEKELIEKEPVTIVLSQQGWLKAIKGYSKPEDIEKIKYKDGDEESLVLNAQTTDKLLIFTKSGRFYTLGVNDLPGGRGFGEPINLMLDIDSKDIIEAKLYKEGEKYLVASRSGKGFIVPAKTVMAQTRNGKQVLNVDANDEALLCRLVVGDHVAVIGTNRKLLVFKADELPEMGRGKGVWLQKYKGAALSDVKFLTEAEGVTWKAGSRVRTEMDLRIWLGKRASAGKMPPTGFPKNNQFGLYIRQD